MRFINLAAVAAVSTIVSTSSIATDASTTSVLEVATLADLRSVTIAPSPNVVNVKSYASVGDGGGGTFVRTGGTACTDDGGVIIKEDTVSHGGVCWYRQFSGPVHLPWYGVTDAATLASGCYLNKTSMDGCDVLNAVNSAFLRALPSAGLGGDGGVTTDGRSIVVNGTLNIPTGQYLTCNGPPGGLRDQIAVSGAVPYYTLPNSIVINVGTAASPLSNTIAVARQAAFFNCIVRPTYYAQDILTAISTSATPTRALIDDLEHTVTGSCVTASDAIAGSEAVDLHDLLVLGCDTGVEIGYSPRAHVADLNIEANVPMYNHDNGGGIKLQNISAHDFVEQMTVGKNIREIDCPITALANDGTGKVKVTYLTQYGDCNVAAEDTALIIGLGSDSAANTTGLETSGNVTITGIPSSTGNDDGIEDIEVGDLASDTTSPTCINAGGTATVTSVSYKLNTVNISPAPTCTQTSGNEHHLSFTANSAAPTALNGRFLTETPGGSGGTGTGATRTIVLTGSSWIGPTAKISYVQNANAVTIDTAGGSAGSNYDTTNIGVGQYLCSNGTAPFCTPPSGFVALGTVALAATETALQTGCTTPSVNVSGSLSGWPQTGLLHFTTGHTGEILAYKLAGSSKINILKRAKDGTNCLTHNSSASMQPAAPTIVATLPWANELAVSTKAQSASSAQPVTLQNDPNISGSFLGVIALNPGYHTWAANVKAGAMPGDQLITAATGNGTTTLTVTGAGCFKIQPGMIANDITTASNVAKIQVDGVSCPTVTLHSNAGTFTTLPGDTIQFTGCGYPANKPWLGNCAATAFLFNNAVGTACNVLHAHAWRNYLHLKDAQETICEQTVFDSGAGNNDTVDPGSYGLLIEGQADKIEIANGKLAAWNGIVNIPGDQGNALGVVNFNIAQTNVVLANGAKGKMIASALKGSDTGVAGVVHLDAAMDSLSMSASRFAGSNYYFSNPATLSSQYCDRSTHFGSGECGLALSAPTCQSGCASTSGVTGADDNFDIQTDGTSTTIILQLAGIYDTTPLCKLTTSGSVSTGASNVDAWVPYSSGSPSNPDTEPYWTQVTIKLSAAANHIYGSCR